MFHYVYVLQNKDKELRTGYTLDLSRPLAENVQTQQEPVTNHRPWRIVYCEAYLHLSDAVRRAQYLKSIHGTKLIKQKLQRHLWR